MLPFGSLWLPVILSTVGIFLASALIWMALPLHASDYGKLPDEGAVADALRKQGAGPGQYAIPAPASRADCRSPEFIEKTKTGPVGLLVLRAPGPPSMGKSLACWAGFCFVVNFVVAYLARHSGYGAGAGGVDVFRFVFTSVFLVHGLGPVPGSIWFGRPWGVTLKGFVDAAAYALIAAGIFAWLWPHA